jgi:lipopolysaccharide biosynthesis regulator YciM
VSGVEALLKSWCGDLNEIQRCASKGVLSSKIQSERNEKQYEIIECGFAIKGDLYGCPGAGIV